MTLTKETILSTPVGRELDALVAEVVLGQKVTKDWPCGTCYDSGAYMASSENPTNFPTLYGEKGPVTIEVLPNVEGEEWTSIDPVPFYSTDIASAWLVVEKLKGFYIMQDEEHGKPIYSVNRYPAATCHCSTAPEAICRAALLSVL